MYNKDLISVIIPCYNGEKYIERCLNALLKQTYQYLEIIIIDDGSTDNTNKILKNYEDKVNKTNIKLKVLYQKNQGQAAAVNNALKDVTGNFLVWQDCDDFFEMDAFEAMHNYLINNPQMDFVRGRAVYRDENELNHIIYEAKSKYPKVINIFDLYVFETDAYCYPGIFMVRMEHFDKCIKNREIYISRAGQNWQLILPIAYNGKCGYLDKVVYNYMVINESHSHSVKKIKDLFKRCNQHKDILYHVIENLNMPQAALNFYKKKIAIKYINKRIKIILSRIKHIMWRKR